MDCFVQTNGIRLHYLDRPGAAPTLVLLPGLTANAHAFDGLAHASLSPRFRTLALDLRGRGLTDDPPTGYSMADHAADVISVLDALDLGQVTLGGHSFGGLLTLYLAARYPERVARLIVIDAAISAASRETAALIRPALARLGQVVPSWEAYLAQMKQAPYFDGWWDPTIESYYRADVRDNPDGSVQTYSRPEAIAAVIEGMLVEDWPAILARIRQPTLLLHASCPYGPPGAPPIVTYEQAHATVSALADCRYVHVPGNHMTMLYGDGARRLVEEISVFVSER
jgi:pimeloyl-ACP methyl ester carboxylesterase